MKLPSLLARFCTLEFNTRKNLGKQNLGKQNLGEQNLGEQNLGKQNLGRQNLGEQNLGKQNLGEQNLGEQNLGEQNLGKENLGKLPLPAMIVEHVITSVTMRFVSDRIMILSRISISIGLFVCNLVYTNYERTKKYALKYRQPLLLSLTV